MLLLALASPGSGDPKPPASAPIAAAPAAEPAPSPGTPIARFVLATERRLRFLTVTTTGIVETRSVDLPGRPQDIAWLAGEPVVLLGSTWANEEPGHAGEIGRVTARGWEPYPAFPDATWTLAHPPNGTEKLPEPWWRLDVNAKGEIWQGRCDWGHFGEGGDCDNTIYARISPAPVVIRPVARTRSTQAPRLQLPKVAASGAVHLAWVKVQPPRQGDRTPDPYKIIRCTIDHQTTELPAADRRDAFLGMTRKIEWLVTSPPIFRAYQTIAGYVVFDVPVVYEGCTESTDLRDAGITLGSHGLLGLHADAKVAIIQGGRLLGTAVPGGTTLSFAP
jgi:hypothetical protein